MKLFVSYTMRDGQVTPSVLRVVEQILKKEGHTVFIDYLNNDSEKKQERVICELETSDRVILLITPQVRQSQWVVMELECAKKNNIKVVPCILLNNNLIEQEYA